MERGQTLLTLNVRKTLANTKSLLFDIIITLSRIRRSEALLNELMMVTLLKKLIIYHIAQSRRTLPQHQFKLSMTVAVVPMVNEPVLMIV